MTRSPGFALAIFAAMIGCAFAPPARAQSPAPPISLLAGSTKTGVISLLVTGTPGSRVTVYERIGSRRKRLWFPPFTLGAANKPNGLNEVLILPAEEWLCSRRTRTFEAVAATVAGTSTATSQYRTRSCRGRLTLKAPRRARPGGLARLTVTDTWRRGARPKLCIAPPGRRLRCFRGALTRDRWKATSRIRMARRGVWRVELRFAGFKVKRRIGVGVRARGPADPSLPVVVLTGDSLMAQVAPHMTDRLGRRVRTVEHVRGGTGLLDGNYFLDLARGAGALRAKAVVLLLGASDFRDIRAGGQPLVCCDPAWVNEYRRRAANLIRAYARGGRTTVYWAIPPATGRVDRTVMSVALATAIALAADDVPGTRTVDLVSTLTPGFVFTDSLMVGGKRIRVRDADGVHFTLEGSKLVASTLTGAMSPVR